MKARRKTLLSEHGARVMRVLKATDPVFPTTEGRSATQSALQHSFERVQRAFRQAHPDFNLPNLSVHDLRHTHASLLLHRKQSLKVVQERLGHASGQVTINTYSHLLPGAQQQAADDLDDMLDAQAASPRSRGPAVRVDGSARVTPPANQARAVVANVALTGTAGWAGHLLAPPPRRTSPRGTCCGVVAGNGGAARLTGVCTQQRRPGGAHA
jgi:hypothetical protein